MVHVLSLVPKSAVVSTAPLEGSFVTVQSPHVCDDFMVDLPETSPQRVHLRSSNPSSVHVGSLVITYLKSCSNLGICSYLISMPHLVHFLVLYPISVQVGCFQISQSPSS